MNKADTSSPVLEKMLYVILEEETQSFLSSLDFLKDSSQLFVEGIIDESLITQGSVEHSCIDALENVHVFQTKEEAMLIIEQLKTIDPEQVYTIMPLYQKRITYLSLH